MNDPIFVGLLVLLAAIVVFQWFADGDRRPRWITDRVELLFMMFVPVAFSGGPIIIAAWGPHNSVPLRVMAIALLVLIPAELLVILVWGATKKADAVAGFRTLRHGGGSREPGSH